MYARHLQTIERFVMAIRHNKSFSGRRTSEWLADQEAHHQVGDLSVGAVQLIDPTSKCRHVSPNLHVLHDLFQPSFGGTLKERWSYKYCRDKTAMSKLPYLYADAV